MNDRAFFTASLLRWHEYDNRRDLPWKQEPDPYRIWLSEIILQQTRAAQGLPYYLAFTNQYPDIHRLADAPDEEVFRLWQGLGYYNRCRNLLATARHISRDLGGAFPGRYEDILQLKGVGPYTAAAIASFGFGLPHAVVDGNVFRVLARYFGIATDTASTEGKKEFTVLAEELLDRERPAAYNQAIMDLGATVCTPAAPRCPECPLSDRCQARRRGLTGQLPVKSKKTGLRNRYFHYLLLRDPQDRILIRKRTERDVWQDLYELPLVEAGAPLDRHDLLGDPQVRAAGVASLDYTGNLTQRLTHQLIDIRFFEGRLPPGKEWPGTVAVARESLADYAFPRGIVRFFEKNLYF